MAQHWSVWFVEDVTTDFDDEIWRDTEDVTVERGMMKLAQCKAVRNDRLTERVIVREDMSGI